MPLGHVLARSCSASRRARRRAVPACRPPNGSAPRMRARQAAAARAIGTRRRVRMPHGLRIAFCKRCKIFAPPGSGSRVRIGRSQARRRGSRACCAGTPAAASCPGRRWGRGRQAARAPLPRGRGGAPPHKPDGAAAVTLTRKMRRSPPRAARATSRAGGTAQATAVSRGGTARTEHLHP